MGCTGGPAGSLTIKACASHCVLFQTTRSLYKLRRPPREPKIRGSNSACDGVFHGRAIPVTSKLALQWLPCQAPGVIGSALGLAGPVSVYCDWVR